jgi:hypothetical protein
VVTVLGVLVSGAVTTAQASPPRVAYLNFADGTESLAQGYQDDAALNRSELCGAPRLGRWLGAAGCGDRESCKRAIAEKTAQLWAPFDVVFTTNRPEHAPYAMVLIGPPGGSCGFGVATGAAPVDCGDRNPSSVAFAFQCAASVGACARLVSHELAHTFGLAHSNRPCDIMAAESPSCADTAFHDEYSRAHGTTCGKDLQNSHQELLAVLGPRSDAPADAAGCSVTRGDQAAGWWSVVTVLAFWLALRSAFYEKSANGDRAGACR